MNGTRRAAAAAALLTAVSGCERPLAPTTCEGRPEDSLERIIAADNARDLAAVTLDYTDDVVWLPPGRPPVVGLAAVRDSYAGMYADFAPALAIAIDETLRSGTLAVARGRTLGTLTARDGDATVINDNFVAAIVCEGGRWRVARMMWGPAAPPDQTP